MKVYMELLCEYEGETHGVLKLDNVKLVDEKKSTMQPITYCGKSCGYCDVHARRMQSRDKSAITCDECKDAITKAHTKGEGI